MTSQEFSSFELPPVEDGPSRMSESEFYEAASTPRPGAAVACSVLPPPKIRRYSMSPSKLGNTIYLFITHPGYNPALGRLQLLVETGTDISEEDFRLLSSAFRRSYIKMIVEPRKTNKVPHRATIHPASVQKFRDVLNSTSDKTYASTNSLMNQVSEDIQQFLTAPEKLENRRRVIQQIRDDIQRVLQQSRDDMS
jgi:hypothetical protein